ncbi:MAG: DUF1402 family protein [Pseudomonadota bacterium]
MTSSRSYAVVLSSQPVPDISLEDYQSLSHLLVLPPGNLAPTEPTVADAAIRRKTREETSFNRKYQKIMRSLRNDPQTLGWIREAAAAFEIDPVHIVGAIVGEHTFNVSAADDIQAYAIVVTQWMTDWASKFESNGVSLADMIKEDEFQKCYDTSQYINNYEFWFCVADVWDKVYQNGRYKTEDQQLKRLKFAFFDPIYSGHTYGLGQLGPLRALMVSDSVAAVSDFPLLNIDSTEGIEQVYAAIIDTQSGMYYMAATIAVGMDYYQRYAGMDIGNNMGVTATLYNLGKERHLAKRLFNTNVDRLKKGQPIRWPHENYYGRWINDHEEEIRALINSQ